MKIQLMVGLSQGWKAMFTLLPSSRAMAAKGVVATASAAAAGDARSTAPDTSTWVCLGCGKNARELVHVATSTAMASRAMPRALGERRVAAMARRAKWKMPTMRGGQLGQKMA
eukprot:CAMPEP_0115425422 /NCGR_PEP_ID=MMETSP0271-20121206/28369_1 /TAXON_ID=71861 /ORGANISM="Scrippsiella trochoidea, Strain CCMP3099" /LENGTH=112 /DNA_ID=CAMNT_0002850315 /DNA_START=235 /DNA_END=573 /DNA_ORIENTATION=-